MTDDVSIAIRPVARDLNENQIKKFSESQIMSIWCVLQVKWDLN